VRWRRVETADTVTLALEPADPAQARFVPGQFTMLSVPGLGEVPISVSGEAVGGLLIQTIRAVGCVTRHLASLQPGASVGVRGPYGRGWPVAAAEGSDLLLVAGGLGLAPLRPALHHALARRERFGAVALCYGTRSPADRLFVDELQGWARRHDVHLAVTVDHAGPDWSGEVGVVTRLLARTPCRPERTVAFVCGPEIMMRFTARELEHLGVAPQYIHLSMERNMQCGIGLCGHCQWGPYLICRDGPVFSWDRIRSYFGVRGL
jgi:NAD(P)H-flavin reductase